MQGTRRVPLLIRGSDALRMSPEQFARCACPCPTAPRCR
jgi:cobalt-zinc-cadmium resistance protein CzcA